MCYAFFMRFGEPSGDQNKSAGLSLEQLQQRAQERMRQRREEDQKKQDIDANRRRVLKLIGGLGAMTAGGALATSLLGDRRSSEKTVRSATRQEIGANFSAKKLEHISDLSEFADLSPERYPEMVESARALAKQFAPTKEQLFRRPALNVTDHSFDLPMNGVPEVKQIRSITDLPYRFLRAVGYLGVQTLEDLDLPDHQSSNPRYRNGDGFTWTCNLYAQDLARLILEKNHLNAYIGHWIETSTGKPVHLSAADRNQKSVAAYAEWSARHRQMDSYDMMLWLNSPLAGLLGWKKVQSQAELFYHLKDGHLAYGGTNPELIQTKQNPNGIPQHNYHNFILGWSPPLIKFPGGIPLLSQSTNCKFLESDLRSNKFNPEGRMDDGNIQYSFFTRKMQDPVFLPRVYR